MNTQSDSNYVNACYFNACRLSNGFEDLEGIAAMHHYHAIRNAETWLDTSDREFIAKYNLPGDTL